MKKFFCLLATMLFSAGTLAATKSQLMLVQDGALVDAQQLAKTDELAYSIDRNSKFCFIGDVHKVLSTIKRLNKQGHFFSGGGGGYTIERVFITARGVAAPKINLEIRSEVTGEIERTIYIRHCK